MRPIFSVEYYQQVGHDEHYLHASQTLTVMPLMRYYPEHRLFGGTARHDKAVDSLLEATLFIHSEKWWLPTKPIGCVWLRSLEPRDEKDKATMMGKVQRHKA
ncbi:uncharacterized protein UV8b_02208 [Ustilaginoidea virens]|uniref:Uncharacterized protein n=1 Tax=Ustilaginoidea virens TaxID=1159556 RepID=A0A8E5HMD1_USTVR|nr:uncharacterized protein UV8b_02208 [Ustilaginoidea virens]QUC17967.1 hypothetical protein UV8b_02208 [Ustilaginoidea virens]